MKTPKAPKGIERNSYRHPLATILVAGMAAAGCGGAMGESAALSPLFRDNVEADLAKVLRRLPQKAQPTGLGPGGHPVVVGANHAERDADRFVFLYDLSEKRALWRTPLVPASRPLLLGRTVAVLVGHDVTGLDAASGRVLWRLAAPGMSFFGAAEDAGNVYVVAGLGGGGRSVSNRFGRITAVDASSGAVRWQYSVQGVLGAPAASGGMVFVPWDRQNLAIIDGATGREVARMRSTDDVWEFVFAAPSGIFYGSHGVYRLTAAGYRGVKTGVPRYEPPLRDLPSQAQLHPDGFSAPLPGRNARDKVGFHWAVASEQPPDSVGVADDTIYLLHYRFVFAFEAQTGRLRWAYRHPADIEGMRAVPGGVFFVEGDGKVTFVGARDGTPVWEQAMGFAVDSVGIEPGTFVPRRNVERSAEHRDASVRNQLLRIIQDPDARLLSARIFAARLLAALAEPDVTRDLLEIYSSRASPPGLKTVVAGLLRERRTGGSTLVDALRRHFDYLSQPPTEPPPLQVLAPTLVAMNERSAVPRLVDQMMDPYTSIDALKEVVQALSALGDSATVGPLKDFLTRYHADSAFRRNLDPLRLVAEGILRLGDTAGRQYLERLAADPTTLEGLGPHIREILAAADAQARAREDARRREEEERRRQAELAAHPPPPPPVARNAPFHLSEQEVNDTVRAHLAELRPCIADEYGRNGRLLTVRFVMILAADGAVVTTTTAPATPEFQSCIQEKFRTIRFPTFRDRRMRVESTLTIREALSEAAPSPTAQP